MDQQNSGDKVATLHDNTATPKDDRRTRGRALAAAVPLASHAAWKVAKDRPDPLQLLKQSDEGRIEDLLPIRYGRMSKSPFTFFRGSASIMASDLSKTPCSNVKVQVCGDSHALNFGAFATPERNVVFDLNDFDETLPGPWEWDIKRLTVSLLLIAGDNDFKGKIGTEAALTAARAYRQKMHEYSRMPILDIWYAKIDWQNVIEETADPNFKKMLKEDLKKAQRNNTWRYFPKITREQEGHYLIKDNPPLIYHNEKDKKFADQMQKGLELYKNSLQEDKQRLLDRYKFCDIAMKVVGIGSVGTTCAIALFLGPDDDPLLLQIKEARQSVMEPYVGKSACDTHGQRVVSGQRVIQSASDIFLGWMRLDSGKDFYVRQLRDTKVKLAPEEWAPKHLLGMAEVMGGVLARAHARSGDSAVISGYLGETDQFDQAMAEFSAAYAEQVEADYGRLSEAIKHGKIKANCDV